MRFVRTLTIRSRITIGSVIVAVGLFAVAAAVFFQVVTSIVARNERSILTAIESELVLDLAAGQTPHLDDRSNGQFFAAFAPDGAVADSTIPRSLLAQVYARTPTTAAGDAPPAPAAFFEITTPSSNSTFLVRVGQYENDEGTWTLVTARDQSASRLLLDDITHALIIGAVVLVAVFGATSWILTGTALAPVRRMRVRADELRAFPAKEDLLPVRGTHDELDELATTLNSFLVRQSDSIAREKQMVSDASHELRTPLAALSAQLEIARGRTNDPAAVDRTLVDALRSVERLSRLASTLLDISRLEALEERPVTPYDALVDEMVAAVDRARLIASPFGVELDYDIAEVDPSAHYGVSATDFGRLVENLARNAVAAASSSGKVLVRIGQSSGPATEARALELVVADDGPGMPESFIPVAFDRFSRPDTARTSSLGGSGLGLALVHTTVTSAGGTVALRNLEPHGLEVAISLPANPPSTD